MQLARFSVEDGTQGPRVLLVSLKAGGTGINLTRANLVFLLDLWWNFATEEQAMDRVYRCGRLESTDTRWNSMGIKAKPEDADDIHIRCTSSLDVLTNFI